MEYHGGNIYKIEKECEITKDEIIDFSSNINPLGVSERLREALRDNIDIIKYYPDPDYEKLKFALAEYLKVDVDKIVVGNGAIDIIFLF